MSNIQVNSISSVNGLDPVNFPTGITGNGGNLILDPKVIQFSPRQLETNVGVSTDIVVTFNQTIQFSGVGTIFIREGSATGSITTSFTCGVSAGATISGTQLIINPTSNLSVGTTYYVTLPSVGIANTFGQFYKGTNSYLFQTSPLTFSATGGSFTYNIASPASPTGFYRYHVFTGSGPLVLNEPSPSADDLQFLLVGAGGQAGSPGPRGAGGAGGGGVITRTGPTLAFPSGSYTITIGAAGPYGSNSSITSPTSTLIAFAGGNGGRAPNPLNGTGFDGGSGGGGMGFPNSPPYSGKPGGNGTSGQGNPGGGGLFVPATPFPSSTGRGGGGGGAGAAGSPGSSTGNGGNGLAVPAFSSPFLSGYMPPSFPLVTLSAIGSLGYYGGGGGGQGFPTPGSGAGGLGGGGNGPYLFQPGPGTAGTPLTGGGGGRASNPGGSGVAMLRYAVPAPQ
jgi:hypothetical protein